MIVGTDFMVARDARFLANPRRSPPHHSHFHSFAPDKIVEHVLMHEDVQLRPTPSVQRVRTSAIFCQTTTHHQHRTPPTHHDPTPTSIISTTFTLSDTRPPTTIRSLSITVRRRCATVNTVQSRNCSRIERWISSSVLYTKPDRPSSFARSNTHALSTLAVASSITKMRLFFSIARARQISCFCPTLRFDPLSLTHDCRPSDIT